MLHLIEITDPILVWLLLTLKGFTFHLHKVFMYQKNNNKCSSFHTRTYFMEITRHKLQSWMVVFCTTRPKLCLFMFHTSPAYGMRTVPPLPKNMFVFVLLEFVPQCTTLHNQARELCNLFRNLLIVWFKDFFRLYINWKIFVQTQDKVIHIPMCCQVLACLIRRSSQYSNLVDYAF